VQGSLPIVGGADGLDVANLDHEGLKKRLQSCVRASLCLHHLPASEDLSKFAGTRSVLDVNVGIAHLLRLEFAPVVSPYDQGICAEMHS
jgi:hypothetical protein